ncbi:hypothetical protein TWF730_001888 [Orbilia blumenaviensis]|uniref:Uncharacterized protein n=1 Tax=Orbilia blumenaviensis TaxID=1796055 RepID=A0AAV9UD83_9PEZI
MKTSFLSIILAISSFLVTPILGLPITDNLDGMGRLQQRQQQQQQQKGEPNIGTCSAQIESTLAMRRWDDVKSENLLKEQKKYLAKNKGNLTGCTAFEGGSVEECVVRGKESSGTIPEVYIHRLCVLLH